MENWFPCARFRCVVMMADTYPKISEELRTRIANSKARALELRQKRILEQQEIVVVGSEVRTSYSTEHRNAGG